MHLTRRIIKYRMLGLSKDQICNILKISTYKYYTHYVRTNYSTQVDSYLCKIMSTRLNKNFYNNKENNYAK